MAVDASRDDAPAGIDDDVIVTEGLTKVFHGRGGGVRAVDDLNLRVRRGEVFGLLGPNGAGKTTTVGMLTTRVIPTSGRATVGGIDAVAQTATLKQVIGVVPQTNTLDRALDVAENLYFHGRYFGMGARDAHSRTTELLEQFRLADRARANVAELSGGMAQRLMVARAIMHVPDVLFLDEPTSGLDPQSRLALWDVIGELHRNGQTIVLTTHYMEEADQLCQRVAIIDHGRLLALDTPAALKRSTGADTEVRIHASGDLPALVHDARGAPGNRRRSRRRGHGLRVLEERRRDAAANHHARRARGVRDTGRRHHRDDTRDRVHRPDRKGAAGMSTSTITVRTSRTSSRNAFLALLLRDLAVLRKEFVMFLSRTVMQPLLLIFVFTYVFPKIGEAIGGSRNAAGFSTLLVGGVIASTMIFQGVQAVALPLVQDFGYTREIEDRVLAPLPVWAVAVEKVASGAIQAVIAALVVFPLAALIPATPVHLKVHWLALVTLLPLAAAMSAALGLTIGTRVEPRQVPLIFSLLVIPMTFLGAVYYPWKSLAPLAWLKWTVLLNPLVYMSEGMRMALTKGVPHMPAVAIYGALLAATAILLKLGIDGFKRRVLS